MKTTTLAASGIVLFMFMLLGHFLKSGQAAPVSLDAAADSISVVTLNLAKETDIEKVLEQLDTIAPVRRADVFLFQEVAQDRGRKTCIAEDLAKRLGMNLVYSPASTGVTDQGLAILSKFPLRDRSVRALKAYDLRFHSRHRIALSATAETPAGPVRLYNAHLDTRLNLGDRLEQLTPVVDDDHGFQGARLVGGDFNTNDFYWLGRVVPIPFLHSQTDGMSAFMIRHGFLNPIPVRRSTFDYAGMHLDWMFVKGLAPLGTAVYPLEFSDHHAVLVRFVKA
jgi:endonuclease/exonuclease/phosphatase family metal-dependent hydrolase